MSRIAEDHRKSELVDKVVHEARERLSGETAALVERFISEYYAHVPPQDFVHREAEALFGAVLAHWKFGAHRPAGTAKLRVYNPAVEEHGWRCEHTVVEIVNDDMPFLVDSISAYLNRQGLTIHVAIHPIYTVRRDAEGTLLEILDPGQAAAGASAESFMHLEITEQSGKRLQDIHDGIEQVLAEVRVAVTDWQPMRQRLDAIVKELGKNTSRLPAEDVGEVCEFLTWIHDNHFTFLGYRDYDFTGSGAKMTLAINEESGLGLLRDPDFLIFRELRQLATMSPEVRAFVHEGALLTVTKTNRLSNIHRPVHMDAIAIKHLNTKGKVVGIHMFVGLFTSSAYHRSVRDIPLLRHKLQKTFDRAALRPNSHDGKALLNILETFPRDELFQVSDEDLFTTAMGILHLQERQRVALFVRRDNFERFLSCLVFVPRDRFTTALRLRFQDILARAFGGEVTASYTQLGDTPLARLHIIVRTMPGSIPPFDLDEIESHLVDAARSWTDHLHAALMTAHGEEQGLALYQRYGEAFPPAYRECFNSDAAITDIAKLEEALDSDELGMSLYRPVEAPDNLVWFKVYHAGRPIPLSDVLPMLEHMGLKVIDEIPYPIHPKGAGSDVVVIHDFGLQTRDGTDVDLGAVRDKFQETFIRVWRGEVESDGFNALVLQAGLSWREVVMLRAYSRYLRQAGVAFSQAYMEQTLTNNSDLARHVVDLFLTVFNPRRPKDYEKRAARIRKELTEGLDLVTSADEDRILRRFINLVESTLRTNYFQSENGEPKPYLSFKLDSRRVEDLPLPRPMVEVTVYSPRMEGIHLRGGKVGRGGIRWSDRREDFRTEILGLMKAQTVKNAVIVPVGAKGGFVLKRPPPAADREAFMQEGIACYKTLIHGLLDITDNLNGDGAVITPPDTVRLDEDDPYLVVAADKGTATFSDIANELSRAFGFWLGDAFASGGSQGYDHKKMAITARGAWESVKRHFREIGTDIQETDFTVVGVGDMSGDVFGNAMLLSPHIRLVAAFNHMHIFVDPDPDPAASFAERKRLFELPRSGWNDYNPKLISKGGGVFERRAKSITLTPEIKKRFAIIKDTVTPNELTKALLRAGVDLLWFGGIGTYVKATHETHAEVGDRANDGTRVNASELRCRVVGEGANLGVTQRGRIEYGLGGGYIYADFIDNSGGVDCSDHEVNIKILVDQVVADGDMTEKQRNTLLAAMTDEVGELVIRDNYQQTQAINVAYAKGMRDFDNEIRLMRMLERTGRLDRAVEFLPDDDTITERASGRLGLAASEIAVLVSYAKIWVYDELLKSDVPDDPELLDDLITYFPTPLRKKYKAVIKRHRLRRELIATAVTNSMINRVGGAFVNELMERTGMGAADIARAYTISRQVLGVRTLWDDISALDNKVPAAVQTQMLIDINHLVEWVTLWFLRHGERPLDIGAYVKEFEAGFHALAAELGAVIPSHYLDDVRERGRPYLKHGVPEDLALRIAGLVNLFSGCDVVRLAARWGHPVPEVAKLYFAVGTRFRLGRLRAASSDLDTQTHWQALAASALVEEIYEHQLALASEVLDAADGETDPKKAIPAWIKKNQTAVARTDQLITELWTTEVNDLSMIAVASRQLRSLSGAKGNG